MDKASLDSIQLTNDEFDEHKRMCEFGIARTNIKLGNFKKGVSKKSVKLVKFMIAEIETRN